MNTTPRYITARDHLASLAAGQEVYIIRSGSWESYLGPKCTVTKAGARDVVLSNGSRWSRRTGHESGKDYSYDYVVPADAETVTRLQKRQAVRSAMGAAGNAWEAFRKTAEHVTAEDIAAMRAALDAVEQAI